MPDKGQSLHPSMPNITFKTKGIAKLLQNLSKYKAAGPDSLPTFILKVAANEIAPVFTKIFQKSYDTGTVPSDWRDANIVPIYKKGDKQQPSNYRLVSLTSISCKIMEHIVHSNIMGHFEKNNILCDEQHGFRKKRSCESQLITTIEGMLSYLIFPRPSTKCHTNGSYIQVGFLRSKRPEPAMGEIIPQRKETKSST